jgi:DNA-binding GntR family transcriptional regulator
LDTESNFLVREDINTQVYHLLMKWIVTRKLKPGQKLSIYELAEELGVSRSPVHQAMTRLVSDNLISVAPRKGYFVVSVIKKTVLETFDVRMALEIMAAERALEHISPDDLIELRRLMKITLGTIEGDRFSNREGYIHGNQDFHQYQIGLAQNEILSRTYSQLKMNMIMWRVVNYNRGGVSYVPGEHIELVEAFEARDLSRINKAIRKHIDSGKRLALDELEAAGGVI